MSQGNYTDAQIKTLDWNEHIRLRPGMYIGKLGDGASSDDGIYVLLKEVIDNSIDEFVMGHGKRIEVTLNDKTLTVRDYGRGIPLKSLFDCAAKINTGAKYDSEAFQKSVGLNGVGIKAVNALSSHFSIQSCREKQSRTILFSAGKKKSDTGVVPAKEVAGTTLTFTPDAALFGNYSFTPSIVERMLRYYAFLNKGLILVFNGQEFTSQNGLLDLLQHELGPERAPLYPPVHIQGTDIEVVFTHVDGQYGEEYFSFVNGQHTTQGGTHLVACREALVRTIRDFSKKAYESSDIHTGIVGAISLRVQEPVFESQTKTKLGSQNMAPNSDVTVRGFINNFVKTALDNFLHQNPNVAGLLLQKVVQNEKERTELKGLQKVAREKAKKAKVFNSKLRDCRLHLGDKAPQQDQTTLFIVEGDSAAGSLTSARDVQTQAVFRLKGKPLNTFSLTRRVVYENDEFNLLQHALDIEQGLENLRYAKIVIATDADVDGKHIRLLLLTFFLQFFPELVLENRLFILQTPLFRVRNNKVTHYCYSEGEKEKAIRTLGGKPEVTRFKGLGEISPDEFKLFIGEKIRLLPVPLDNLSEINRLLTFYMGKNSEERQAYIMRGLRIERDEIPSKIAELIGEVAPAPTAAKDTLTFESPADIVV